MRADMSKVITERPRWGARLKAQKGERKRLQRGLESLPLRESTAPGRKPSPRYLSDLLGPLYRFLEGSVGRPWDKVYSEIRERIHTRSQVQIHVLDHVREYVERLDGPLPWFSGWAPFFVDPRSGLLRKRDQRRLRRPPSPPDALPVGDSREVRILDGIWYEITYAPVPLPRDRDGPYVIRDVLTGERGEAARFLDRKRYAARKRQLGKKEILTSHEFVRLPLERTYCEAFRSMSWKFQEVLEGTGVGFQNDHPVFRVFPW